MTIPKKAQKKQFADEFESLDFKDKRLNKRMEELCNHFNRSPKSIVRQVFEDVHQCKAAYRFWANDKVKADQILNSHKSSIRERITGPVVLEIQDSTELDYRSHLKKEGKGQIGRGVSNSGYQMHMSLIITPQREPLGISSLRLWSRKDKRKIKGRELRKHQWEEKESYKWVTALGDSDSIYNNDCKRIVISDRESDFYEYLRLLTDEKRSFIIRLKWNRKVSELALSIKDYLETQPSLGTLKVHIGSRGGYFSRKASCLKLDVKAVRKNLEFEDENRKKDQIALTIVQAKEPVENGEEWILLTNLDSNNFEEACQVVDWYSSRWEIEDFFKLLKGSFKIEDIRLSTKERTEKLITFLSILCYRLFWISRVSRVNPHLPAALIFLESEISIATRISNRRGATSEVSIQDMIINIAMLGGYWNRRSDPPPGTLVILRGWKRLQDFINLQEQFDA